MTKRMFVRGEVQTAKNKKSADPEIRDFYAHDFDFVADIMFEKLETLVASINVPIQSEYVCHNAAACLIFVGQCHSWMKYWNEYHYIWFAKHMLLQLLKACVVFQEYEGKLTGYLGRTVPSIELIIGAIVRNICSALKEQPVLLNDSDIWDTIKQNVVLNGYQSKATYNRARRATKNMLRGWVRCCWENCCAMNQEIGYSLRMCSGCRMSYYLQNELLARGRRQSPLTSAGSDTMTDIMRTTLTK